MPRRSDAAHKWSQAESEILMECIMVPSRTALRGEYISWIEVAENMNRICTAKGNSYNQFNSVQCARHYATLLIFIYSPEDFDVKRIGVKNIPWSVNELNRLRDFIPDTLIGGRDESGEHIHASNGEPDWGKIAASMRALNLREDLTAFTAELAWSLRIEPDYLTKIQGQAPQALVLVRAAEDQKLIDAQLGAVEDEE